jgi:plastocyanin
VTHLHRSNPIPARTLLALGLLAGIVVMVSALVRAPAVRAAEESVDISDFQFQPGTLAVQVGDTVTWTNSDSADHTVTSQAGAPESFDSGTLGQGDTFSFTFDQAGTYPYVCSIHSSMTAEIVVEEAAAATPAATQLPDGAAPDPQDRGSGGFGWLTLAGALLLMLGLGGPLLARVRERRAA